MISFECSREDLAAAATIAKRFRKLQRDVGVEPREQSDIVMDLIATKANGRPDLDLQGLKDASDSDLAHDVGGIARHLDRDDSSPTAGQLLNCFLPRYARH